MDDILNTLCLSMVTIRDVVEEELLSEGFEIEDEEEEDDDEEDVYVDKDKSEVKKITKRDIESFKKFLDILPTYERDSTDECN